MFYKLGSQYALEKLGATVLQAPLTTAQQRYMQRFTEFNNPTPVMDPGAQQAQRQLRHLMTEPPIPHGQTVDPHYNLVQERLKQTGRTYTMSPEARAEYTTRKQELQQLRQPAAFEPTQLGLEPTTKQRMQSQIGFEPTRKIPHSLIQSDLEPTRVIKNVSMRQLIEGKAPNFLTRAKSFLQIPALRRMLHA